MMRRFVLVPVCLLFASAASAATLSVAPNSFYFNNHIFSTFQAPYPAVPPGYGNMGTYTFAITKPVATHNNSIGIYFASDPNSIAFLPAGSGWPSPKPSILSYGLAGGNLTLRDSEVAFTFNADIPWGTHLHFQDVDYSESGYVRFYDAAGNLIDPSGFDYLLVSSAQTPAVTFSATRVFLQDMTSNNVNTTISSVIVRSAKVRTVILGNDLPNNGGGFNFFLSYDPSVFSPSIAITKSASAVQVSPNGTLTYTITATNNGGNLANGTVIKDLMPLGISAYTWVCTASGGAVCPNASGSGSINETVAVFPVGGAVEYIITATVNAAPNSSITNVVNVSPGFGGICQPSTCSVLEVVNVLAVTVIPGLSFIGKLFLMILLLMSVFYARPVFCRVPPRK